MACKPLGGGCLLALLAQVQLSSCPYKGVAGLAGLAAHRQTAWRQLLLWRRWRTTLAGRSSSPSKMHVKAGPEDQAEAIITPAKSALVHRSGGQALQAGRARPEKTFVCGREGIKQEKLARAGWPMNTAEP